MTGDFRIIANPQFYGDGRIELKDYRLPAELGWFNGHFPGREILPGVAQISMAKELIRLKAKLSGKKISLRELKRVRFTRPIYPGDSIDISVAEEPHMPGSYSFNVFIKGESASSGILIIQEVD